MLDDPAAVAAGDPGGMLSLIAGLGGQLRRGFEAGNKVALATRGVVRAIVVCGMGGSAIAGDLLRSAFGDRIPCPILVRKVYALPPFCGPDTVVVAVSYSGENEETLAAFAEAFGRGCPTLGVSSGGTLADMAGRNGGSHVALPSDVRMPRAALGYLGGAILGALDRSGLIAARKEAAGAATLLDHLAVRLGSEEREARNEAKAVARWLAGRTPVIWGSEGLAEAAALRWKTQMNENAKVPAFHSILPELDHNEVEGWASGEGKGFAAVVLRHPGEHPRIADRIAATVESIAASGLETREVHAEGGTALARLLSLIMLGDFASTYLALLRGVDPSPVPVLSGLKARLSR
jgi:glucose/mannose-6-phosphate isomerase